LPDKTPDQKDQARKRVQDYMKYSGMAMQMGIIILLGVFAGKKLDEYFHTSPFLMVALALLSIFVALYSTLKDLL
jgi:F0F1-type ATP synthase assembly protein I